MSMRCVRSLFHDSHPCYLDNWSEIDDQLDHAVSTKAIIPFPHYESIWTTWLGTIMCMYVFSIGSAVQLQIYELCKATYKCMESCTNQLNVRNKTYNM